MKQLKKNIVLIFSNTFIIITSFLFSKTNGLMAGSFFVKDFPSSMSDNGIEIEFSRFLFLIPLICNLIKCRKYFLWKYIVNNLIILIQLFLLIGPLLDGCSYIKTIFEGRNIVLAFYFISFLAFIFFVNYFFEFPKRNFKTKK